MNDKGEREKNTSRNNISNGKNVWLGVALIYKLLECQEGK